MESIDLQAAVLAEVIKNGPITANRILVTLETEFSGLNRTIIDQTLTDLEMRRFVRQETTGRWVKEWKR